MQRPISILRRSIVKPHRVLHAALEDDLLGVRIWTKIGGHFWHAVQWCDYWGGSGPSPNHFICRKSFNSGRISGSWGNGMLITLMAKRDTQIIAQRIWKAGLGIDEWEGFVGRFWSTKTIIRGLDCSWRTLNLEALFVLSFWGCDKWRDGVTCHEEEWVMSYFALSQSFCGRWHQLPGTEVNTIDEL